MRDRASGGSLLAPKGFNRAFGSGTGGGLTHAFAPRTSPGNRSQAHRHDDWRQRRSSVAAEQGRAMRCTTRMKEAAARMAAVAVSGNRYFIDSA